jgi:DNA (cytosine-5)-methyltransferase 1
MTDFSFLEFFCGGGMTRAGLGPRWRCRFANDFDAKKAAAYARNWGGGELRVKDVRDVETDEIPGRADLAWASFPCQDLSLAGLGAGLAGERSGAFWPFWRLIRRLAGEGRAPDLIALENVRGALTSHGGADFRALGEALSGEGYRFGAIVVDAIDFVPQSRPRLFILAVAAARAIPGGMLGDGPSMKWHPAALRDAAESLSGSARRHWLWWRLPEPPRRDTRLLDLIEDAPAPPFHARAETDRLLSLMNELHLRKIRNARADGRRLVGAVYRRTRPSPGGGRIQRAEIRFDGVAGCLRTPAGGSSRQTILVVDGAEARSRLLSPREAARLMGLPDSYVLPERYNEAYHLVGDGVVVPVVRHLAETLLEPILAAREAASSPPRLLRGGAGGGAFS